MRTIDAQMIKSSGWSKESESKKEWINELNVFPVPDGDTGTNMTMTITAAASEVSALADVNMETLAKCISSGSLRGEDKFCFSEVLPRESETMRNWMWLTWQMPWTKQ